MSPEVRTVLCNFPYFLKDSEEHVLIQNSFFLIQGVFYGRSLTSVEWVFVSLRKRFLFRARLSFEDFIYEIYVKQMFSGILTKGLLKGRGVEEGAGNTMAR